MKIFDKAGPFRKILTSRVASHIYFWAFLFLFTFLTPSKERVSLATKLMNGLVVVGAGLFPVYFHFFVFERYFYKKKYVLYAICFIPVMILYIGLFKEISHWISKDGMGYLGFTMLISFLILLTTSIKVLKRGINERFLLQEIKAKQVQTELELLKAQVNPHFLFNTLNNLYGMAKKQDKATADGIAGLAHLMRYMIHDSKADKISLQKEIEQIQRLIELQKLRFSENDEIDIKFRVEGDPDKVFIPPMLMIPFVENAFKHGISLAVPSFISILVEATEEQVRFVVENSLPSRRKDEAMFESGVGLQNVRRRLELLYPDSHQLTTRTTADTFRIELVLRTK